MHRPAFRLLICLIGAVAIAIPGSGGVARGEISARQVLDSIEKAKRALLASHRGDQIFFRKHIGHEAIRELTCCSVL